MAGKDTASDRKVGLPPLVHSSNGQNGLGLPRSKSGASSTMGAFHVCVGVQALGPPPTASPDTLAGITSGMATT